MVKLFSNTTGIILLSILILIQNLRAMYMINNVVDRKPIV